MLGGMGNHIAKQAPEFDSRNYGYGKLSELVASTNLFEVETRNGGNNKTIWVRLKKRARGRAASRGSSLASRVGNRVASNRPGWASSLGNSRVSPGQSGQSGQSGQQQRPQQKPVEPAGASSVAAAAAGHHGGPGCAAGGNARASGRDRRHPEPAPVFSAASEDEPAGSASTLDPGSRGTPGLVTRKRAKRPEVALSDTPWPIDQSVFAAPGTTVLSAQVVGGTHRARPGPPPRKPRSPPTRKLPQRKPPPRKRAGQEGGEEGSGVR